MITHDYEQQV